MKNNKKTKKTTKVVLIFITVLTICYFAGVFTGRLIRQITDAGVDFSGFEQNVIRFCAYIIPYLYLAVCVVTVGICFVYYKTAKNKFAAWDGENEGIINKVEYKLSKCMLVSNVAFIVGFFLFGLWVYISEQASAAEIAGRISYIIVSASLILSMILTVVIQRSVVELEKKINPEKKGELLDIKFVKDWENSFDEAQKLMQYKAAYKAFKCTNYTCTILFVLCIIGELALNTGIVPLVFVTVIWLVSTIAFQIEGIRLENKK